MASKKLSVMLSVFLLVSISQAYVGHGEIVFEDDVEVEIEGITEECGVDGLGSITLDGHILNTGMTSEVDSWFALAEPEEIEEINFDRRGEGYFSAEVEVDVLEDDTVTAGVLAENDAGQDDSDYTSYQATCDGDFVEECEGNPSFSGCVRPLVFDPHPYDSRDTVATHAFDEDVAEVSFSTLFGSSVFIQEGSIVGSSEASGDTIEQPWLDPEGWDYPWAAGDFSFDEASISNGWTYDEEREYPHHTEGEIEGEEHYTYPDPDRYDYDEDYEESPEEYCANAVLAEDEDDPQFDCPEDYGLADNLPEEDGGTVSDATYSIGFGHSSLSPQDMGESYDVINPGSDTLYYRMDLFGEELSSYTTRSITGRYEEDLDSAVEGATEIDVSGTDVEFEVEEIGNMPDFYKESDKAIRSVYLQEDGIESIGSVTAYYLIENSYDHYGSSSTGSGSAYCTDTPCDYDTGQVSGCDSTTTRTPTQYSLETDVETFTPTTHRYETEKSPPGYSEVIEENNPEVDITYNDDVDSYESGSYDECTGGTATYDDDSCNYNCSIDSSDGGTVYHVSEERDFDDDYGTKTVTFGYLGLDYAEETAFNVDPARNPSHGDHPENVLFSGDTYESRIVSRGGFGGHFSVEIDDEPQRNNPSVSSSEFDIYIADVSGTPDQENNFFMMERVDFGTANVDGIFGEANGMIAHASSPGESGDMGYNELFTEREVAEGNMPEDFVNEGDVSGEGCGSYYCVNRFLLTLENLDNWGNPMNPATGVDYEIMDSQGVEESYSTCRLYQELHDGGPESTNLRCQFDHAEQYPGGPTYSRERPVYPDDFQ